MINSVKQYINMPLLYNHWYVAGTTDEFTTELSSKVLLERSILFFRTEKGEIKAFQNRCLHRSFPLSDSKVIDGEIVCGYHGARYNSDGELTKIPCQKNTPKRSLKQYPLKEYGPYVYIWMGDSDPDYNSFPDKNLPHFQDPDYRMVKGDFPINGSYLLMQENLNDLTHFAYLHHESFGFDDSIFENEIEVKKTEEGVACYRTETDLKTILAGLPPTVGETLKDQKLTMIDENVGLSPGIFKSYAWILTEGEEKITENTRQVYVIHNMTPINKTSCHYWWSVSYNFGQKDEQFWEFMPNFLETGYKEDVWACEQMQSLLNSDSSSFKEMNIAGDKAGILFRNVMLNWAKEEYGDNLESADLIASSQE